MNGQTDDYAGFPQPPDTPMPPAPRRRSGARAGVILIVVGAAFLVAQLVPGLSWWSLWPLVIVVAGIIQAVTPGDSGWDVNRLFDGLVTVSFGLVFLAVTTGYVSFDVFWSILRLWPVFLIALGFDLLGKALHRSWVRAIGSVVLIGALAWAVASQGLTAGSTSADVAAGEITTEPVGRVQEAELSIDAGLAKVRIEDGDDLVALSGDSPWGAPRLAVDREGDKADVAITTPEVSGWVMPETRETRLDVALSDTVVWDARVSTGVSSLDADLSDVPIRRLTLRPGIAECSVRMGDVPRGVARGDVVVDAGISAVTLLVPADAEARIESDSGLTGHVIGDDFESRGDRVWSTSGYDDAAASGEPVWDIMVKSGIGSVTVDTY